MQLIEAFAQVQFAEAVLTLEELSENVVTLPSNLDLSTMVRWSPVQIDIILPVVQVPVIVSEKVCVILFPVSSVTVTLMFGCVVI